MVVSEQLEYLYRYLIHVLKTEGFILFCNVVFFLRLCGN